MWPETKKLLSEKQLIALDAAFAQQLDDFMKDEKLDEGFKASFKSIYLPLAKWVATKHTNQAVVIGINGAQGSGKSTLAKLLASLLNRQFQKKVLHLSIDDLYLSKMERECLAATVHPLLATRGVPGTHNVELGINILDGIKHNGVSNIPIPEFDKSIDDLVNEDQWRTLSEPVDIVLFEGWCVGVTAQDTSELSRPVNELEATADSAGQWRSYVNAQLAGSYQTLFSRIDYLIMLKVPDMESIFQWRCLQESKLSLSSAGKKSFMSEKEIKRFIMYFERITKHSLETMPARADVLLALDKTHQIKQVTLSNKN